MQTLLGEEIERVCMSEDKREKPYKSYWKDREIEGERKQESRFEDDFWRERSRECAWAKAKAESSGDSCII